MKSIDLLKAMDGLEEQFLLEADPFERDIVRGLSFRRYQRLVSAFAVLLLCTTLLYPLLLQKKGIGNAGPQMLYDAAPAESESTAETSEAKSTAEITFLSLPQELAGGKLSETHYEEDGTLCASYYSEEGVLVARIFKADHPTYMIDEGSPDTLQRESCATESGEGKLYLFEKEGYYYAVQLTPEAEDLAAEEIMQRCEKIR